MIDGVRFVLKNGFIRNPNLPKREAWELQGSSSASRMQAATATDCCGAMPLPRALSAASDRYQLTRGKPTPPGLSSLRRSHHPLYE